MKEYIAIQPMIVGNMERGFETAYEWDGERFPTRKQAFNHQLRNQGSEDFNIGIVEGDVLVGFDHMEDIEKVAEALDLYAPAGDDAKGTE